MGSNAWAIEGPITKELLTYHGAVLWHNNPREVEWLFPKLFEGGGRCVELPSKGIGRPLMRLQDHPDMQAVRFPLRIEDFRTPVHNMRKE